MIDADAIGLCQLLFKLAGAHLFGATSIRNTDLLRAQALALHCDINRRHTAADDDARCGLPAKY